MTTPAPENTYDAVPYSNHTFPQTHPDRMAAIATLCGLAPPPPRSARVLEIGSGRGANLLGIAASLPDARCVGIELSRRQQEEAAQTARDAGIDNVEFRHMSFTELGDEDGDFDYIIAQGVFSWVEPALQEALLDLITNRLSPSGVAYVSYNVLPGWGTRGTLRQMMQHHTRAIADPFKRIEQARALLEFLADNARGNAYRAYLGEERDRIRTLSDGYLFHDHLEVENHPLYFHEMVDRTQAHGLRYLAETEFATMLPHDLAPETRQTLLEIAPDQIQLEQYMDFLRQRAYRQSLLVHAEQTPSYDLPPERLHGLRVAFAARSSDPVDLTEGVEVTFEGTEDRRLKSASPIIKAALQVLSERWPTSLPFEELCLEARRKLSPGEEVTEEVAAADRGAIGHAVISVYATAFSPIVELRVGDPPLATVVSERPRAAPYARFLAAQGSGMVNLFNEMVSVGDLEGHLLRLADGTRDRAAIVDELTELAASGEITLRRDGEPVRDPEAARAAFVEAVDDRLPALVRAGLMEA